MADNINDTLAALLHFIQHHTGAISVVSNVTTWTACRLLLTRYNLMHISEIPEEYYLLLHFLCQDIFIQNGQIC
jgi:hypothetical protein